MGGGKGQPECDVDDGRTGLRLVDPGNYVQVGDSSNIVVITQTKPVSVIFTIPEDELPRVASRMAKGAELVVSAYDRDQKRQLAQGKVQVIDNQIDTTTGTIKLRAISTRAAILMTQFSTRLSKSWSTPSDLLSKRTQRQ